MTNGRPWPAARNELLAEFLRTGEGVDLAAQARQANLFSRLRLGGDLILLKTPSAEEQGVVLVKYSSAFFRLAASYDLPRLIQDWKIVLEPSGIGYKAPEFYLFLDAGNHVIVQAHQPSDEAYLRALNANLIAVPIGSSYWVDDKVFHPRPDVSKTYLAILIGAWTPLKRHKLLFQALSRLRDPSARVALVGYPWGGFTRSWIEEMVDRYGLCSQVDIFENIEPEHVNRLLNQSSVNLLLSEREGGNKAIYEGMFAGVPCIVSAQHQGIRLTDVNAETGMLVEDEKLADALRFMRSGSDRFTPREWAIRNAGYRRSTQILDETLTACAEAEGRPWRRPILPKVNRPNLRYESAAVEESMRPHYASLVPYLRSATLGPGEMREAQAVVST